MAGIFIGHGIGSVRLRNRHGYEQTVSNPNPVRIKRKIEQALFGNSNQRRDPPLGTPFTIERPGIFFIGDNIDVPE